MLNVWKPQSTDKHDQEIEQVTKKFVEAYNDWKTQASDHVQNCGKCVNSN